ncbi:STAS/SEC14 domain-containing protein [Sphingomonas sp. HITSZ_GF]|uniref:STAS/SEC14 domain-containing protein n=1 Tax=Sphingomonas sp. HITSZ_GF TaxID=3037247 RepID=UPI00240D7E77|nr:STAS/SEC14 domain-containing protein [Sphingomonas sp. HITSZ_GF]MDG2533194.1 STAS/SEC14 domain-containing protein [Sphingomonas sp. HITSZ_GF]
MPNSVSHSIEVDLERKLLDLRIGGLVSPEDAAWIGEELRAAIRALGPDVGKHVTLYDASAVHVVPQETVELIKHTLDNPAVRQLWARKVAFVVHTALARLQVQRLREVRADIGVFDDRETAIAWLMEP